VNSTGSSLTRTTSSQVERVGTVTSGSVLISNIATLWQQFLGKSVASPEANFFDLGGDPATAVALFEELARMTGRELPPMFIYEAPTVRLLAELFQQATPPRFSPLIQLKSGSRPPVVLIPGLGGSVMEFHELVRRQEWNRPIFGMQSTGLDGQTKPFTTLEQAAAFGLDALKVVQPEGPYCLIGYSLGGLIALEIARLLGRDNNQVALLVLIDSYPHYRYLSVLENGQLQLQRVRQVAMRLRKRLILPGSQVSEPSLYKAPPGAAFAPALQAVRQSSYEAWKQYRPRFYDGKTHFIRAAVQTKFPGDPLPIWSPLVKQLTIETSPGDHLGMITTYASSLAGALTPVLNSALPAA
jgi:acetoacetyl-CoA synthetase